MPGFEPWVIPIAVGILVGLFAIQSHGTARVGALFGPVMLFYFVTLAVLGVMHIVDRPQVILATVNPLTRPDLLRSRSRRAPSLRWGRSSWR